jgi:hypothetical protein
MQFRVEDTIVQWDPPRAIALRQVTPRGAIRHAWVSIEPHGTGSMVTVGGETEPANGLASLLKPWAQRRLRRGVEASLARIKALESA